MESKSKKELARAYGISMPTLRRKLSQVPYLRLKSGTRILMPADLDRIFRHLGNPFQAD